MLTLDTDIQISNKEIQITNTDIKFLQRTQKDIKLSTIQNINLIYRDRQFTKIHKDQVSKGYNLQIHTNHKEVSMKDTIQTDTKLHKDTNLPTYTDI